MTTHDRCCGGIKQLDTLRDICNGEGGFMINILCFPFVMLWNALVIYVFPCFQVLGRRIYHKLFGICLTPCWTYTDSSFEGDSALGSATTGGGPLSCRRLPTQSPLHPLWSLFYLLLLQPPPLPLKACSCNMCASTACSARRSSMARSGRRSASTMPPVDTK